MIDLELYRSRIGCFSKEGCSRCPSRKNSKHMGFFSGHTPEGSVWVFCKYVCLLFYIYVLCIIMSIATDVARNGAVNNPISKTYIELTLHSNFNNTILKSFLNLAFLFMLKHIFIFNMFGHGIVSNKFVSSSKFKNIKFNIFKNIFKKKGRTGACVYLLVCWTAMLNLILIVISHPAIVNPGPISHPSRLSVLYLNAEGLYSAGHKHFFS